MTSDRRGLWLTSALCVARLLSGYKGSETVFANMQSAAKDEWKSNAIGPQEDASELPGN
jgi:hypothetical protein